MELHEYELFNRLGKDDYFIVDVIAIKKNMDTS